MAVAAMKKEEQNDEPDEPRYLMASGYQQRTEESVQKSRRADQSHLKAAKSCPRAIQINVPLIFVAKMHPWN